MQRITIICGGITKLAVDAIVNAANSSPLAACYKNLHALAAAKGLKTIFSSDEDTI